MKFDFAVSEKKKTGQRERHSFSFPEQALQSDPRGPASKVNHIKCIPIL